MDLVWYDQDLGGLQVNYAWLPTWLGINTSKCKQLEQETAKVRGADASQNDLNEAFISIALKEFPRVQGLEGYLRSILLLGHDED